jgi:hypothetical protein
MKTFAQYLTESEKTFDYRIKIVGDVDSEFMKAFKDGLKKFDVVKINDVKKTPIQHTPTDFPAFTNQAVNMLDVSFRYPATPPQIAQVARLLGLDENRICTNDLHWQEGMDTELLGIQDQNKDLLTSNYPEPTAEQKKIKKDYAAAAQDKEVVKNSASAAKWVVAGGKTPPAKTTNDLPMGITSPMTTVKRPPKPATGFQK